jgi:23S rRNA (uridine2552-2'-O)-methyltransferase
MKKPTGSGGKTGSGKVGGEGKRTSGRGLGGQGMEARSLRTRVKTAKGRKLSSMLWLERQLNDPYVKKAKAEGYASRAAYKLKEIDDRYHLLHKGAVVIDLGAAPGGWSQVSVERTGSSAADIRVVGIDYLEMAPVPGATILQLDFLDESAPKKLMDATGGRAPDLVVSDMASPTIGHRRTDHIRTMHLVEVALDFAISVLKPGGHFLTKTFQGGTEAALLDRMKRNFKSVHHVKPPASRDQSVELYLLAKGFKGRNEAATAHDDDAS